MKRKIYIFIFAISIFIFFGSIYLNFLVNKPIDVKSIYISANITDKSGLDLNSSFLSFGNVAKGTVSSRSIIFSNNYERKIEVFVSLSGKIKEVASFENNFVILPGESKKISFSVSAGHDTREGFYDGEAVFKIYLA